MNPSIEHPVPPPPAPPGTTRRRSPRCTFARSARISPARRLAALYARSKPGYERWFLREGDAARPSWLACERALRHWLPELWPTFERVLAAVGDSDRTARFLSLYQPTPFLAGCSQAAWARESVALVRNYDYSPRLADGVLLYALELDAGDRDVGLPVGRARRHEQPRPCGLDGLRRPARAVGDGLRHHADPALRAGVLPRRTRCAGGADARAGAHGLQRRTGRSRRPAMPTVYLGPDRPPLVSQERVSTNHQGSIGCRTMPAPGRRCAATNTCASASMRPTRTPTR